MQDTYLDEDLFRHFIQTCFCQFCPARMRARCQDTARNPTAWCPHPTRCL